MTRRHASWVSTFPPEERDSYRETLFSHLGSNVMADRERAVLKDPSLKWEIGQRAQDHEGRVV